MFTISSLTRRQSSFAQALRPQEIVSDNETYVEKLNEGLTIQPGLTGTTRGIQIMAGASAAIPTTSQEVFDFTKTLEREDDGNILPIFRRKRGMLTCTTNSILEKVESPRDD